MIREWIPPLMKNAIGRRSPVCFDLAIDLLIPPLTLMTAATLLVSAAAACLFLFGAAGPWLPLLCGGSIAAIGIYVFSGLLLNRAPARVYKALLYAPVFIAWKLWLNVQMMSGKGLDRWVRTGRTRIESPPRPARKSAPERKGLPGEGRNPPSPKEEEKEKTACEKA